MAYYGESNTVTISTPLIPAAMPDPGKPLQTIAGEALDAILRCHDALNGITREVRGADAKDAERGLIHVVTRLHQEAHALEKRLQELKGRVGEL